MRSTGRALVAVATLILVAGSDFNFNLGAEIEKCLALRNKLFSNSKTKCLDEVQKIAVLALAFTGEQRAIAVEMDRTEDRKDRKNTLAIPGMEVDTARPLSVAVALVFVVSVMAGGILQCCGRKSPKPHLILLIFLGFACGLVGTIWFMFPTHWTACIFALTFSLLTCGAISIHFLHDDRLDLSQVWNPLTAANQAQTQALAQQAQAQAQAAQAQAQAHLNPAPPPAVP
jgi:hypothetical protein